MSGDGWFKIHRDMFESDIWADVTTFRLFIFLIGKASHQDGFKYRGMILNKGQWIRSYRKLADDLSYKEGRGFKKYSLSTIKRCVNKLIESERVNVNETELGTLFTIVNYAKYQHSDVSETETQNGLSGEVRTNAELMQNEDGTNAEQDQELKNLRTKELKREEEEGKKNNHENKETPILVFQKNFGMLKPILQESFLSWCDDVGDEVMIAAMKLAAQKGGRTFDYIQEILREWTQAGLDGIDEVRAYEQEKLNRKNKAIPFKKKKRPQTSEEVDALLDKFKEG